ncbi:glycosyltransferase, partial [Candidatus Pelagibacter sp.]|nr:glycosyltransferase [Candidatus Pelagibacter sp.]
IILSLFFDFKVVTRSNSSPTGWGQGKIKKLIFKIFFHFAEDIIVNSKKFKNEFKKEFNINSLLIYNPLNKIDVIKKSKENLNFDFFNDKKTLKIINIARFTDQKDHLTLLRSFEIVVKKIKCKLLIMGYGNNEKIMKHFIKRKNLKNVVKIINFQKNPYNYLKKADLFVLTSKFEGLPNVLLEAQVLNKFVISSNCPTGPSEILKNGKYGDLFNIGDYRNLANLIINYNSKSNKYKSKIKLAHNSLERFNYEINCEKYYKTILKRL